MDNKTFFTSPVLYTQLGFEDIFWDPEKYYCTGIVSTRVKLLLFLCAGNAVTFSWFATTFGTDLGSVALPASPGKCCSRVSQWQTTGAAVWTSLSGVFRTIQVILLMRRSSKELVTDLSDVCARVSACARSLEEAICWISWAVLKCSAIKVNPWVLVM